MGLIPKCLQEELLAPFERPPEIWHTGRNLPRSVGCGRSQVSLAVHAAGPGRGVCSSPRQHGQRIMRFEILGIEGRTAVRRFDGADSVVFNALTRYGYELPAEDFDLLSKAVPRTVADQQ